MPRVVFLRSKGGIRVYLADHELVLGEDGAMQVEEKASKMRPIAIRRRPSGALNRAIWVLTIVSAVLAVAALAMTVWQLISGQGAPPVVSISAKGLGIALIGSLISLGGTSLISVKGQLADTRRVSERRDGCPFMPVLTPHADPIWRRTRPGDPEVCVKCPLGIDISSEAPGGLIHVCLAYPALHAAWIEARESQRR